MNKLRSQEFRLILQVLGAATLMALGIKGWMPQFKIPATDSIALIAIVLPSAIVSLILKVKA